MRIFIPAASLTAGTVAASLTFATVSYTGEAAANATHHATRLAAIVTGAGVNLVFGSISALIAERATMEFGQQWLAPAVRTGTRQTAFFSAAAVGASVIAVSTILIHGGTWAYERGRTAIRRYLTQPPTEVVACITDVEDDIQLVTFAEEGPLIV